MSEDREKRDEQVPHVEKDVKVKSQEPLERPRFECVECNKMFPSPLDLEEHKKQDHAAKNTSAVA
ncbi:hypothetical protein [Nitrososphaera viennensis]|uniref:C2H2-type domain-containing protein n=2 Tax=Nitrososphaera viennensis TaxID=1034015 RepID=A0A060HSU0_9ARCH|nr:hypothetical protein [Nitrososphaera viennensis]AIC16232.1 hypothetical protein NVIE_019710 [Nitrososphaera viennensis EN76]UVS68172.1 hypothetical protein NWT39_09700 [Nitrososphaera viennensis]